MFRRVKHYHQWLRSSIHLKTKFSQSPSDSVRLQGPSKRNSSDLLYPVSSVKEGNRKGGKCKISRVLQSPVSCTQASPKVEASNRPKQAQHLPTCRKVQNGNTRVHQGLSASRGMGVVDRPNRRLPSQPHPPKLKEVPKVLPQVASVSVHFPSLRTSHDSSGLYNDCKRGEADGPVKGNQTSPVPGRLADQGPVAGRSTSKHSDSGGPKTVLRVDNKSEVRTKANSGLFLRGLRIPSRFSPCKTHSREMAQTSGFDPTTQVKTCFDCRCLMSLIGLLASIDKMVPEGRLHMRPFQFHLKEHWRFPQSLDSLLPWTETISAHLDWWQNPKRDERRRPSSQRPQYPTLYRRLKRRLGRSLRANPCKRSVVRPGKKATHKCSRAEGGFSGPSKVQGPVSKPNSVSCHRQLNSGSLHKQTRWNPLGGDVRSPVEDHDLVPSLPDNTKSQTHSRVSECDGRPAVQVEPSSVSSLVTASAGVQTDLSQVFTPHVDLFATRLNHKVPLYVSPVPDQNTCDIDALNINWSGLTAYAYPPTALLRRVIQKVRQSNCLIIVIAPGWPGIPWFWDLVQLSTEVPLQLPVSRTFLKQSHNYVFHSDPQHLNLHAWCLRVASSKNKASLWKWQRELLQTSLCTCTKI